MKKLTEVFEWLFPPGARYKGIPILVTFLAASISLIERFSTGIIPPTYLGVKTFDLLIYVSHLLLPISFMQYKMDYSLDINKLIKKYPKIYLDFAFVEDIAQFKKYSKRSFPLLHSFSRTWDALCWVWFFYYILKLISLFNHFETEENVGNGIYILIYDCSSTLLNVLSTFYVFILFIILTYPKLKGTKNNLKFKYPRSLNLFIVFLIGFIALYFVCRITSYEQTDFTWSSGSFDFTTGLISCIVFSLFTGRLDNKLLKIEATIISILFVYSAIQFIYPLVEWFIIRSINSGEKNIHIINLRAAIMIFALIAKGTIFKILLWGEKNHRLFIFMVNLLSLINNNNEKRKELYKKLDF